MADKLGKLIHDHYMAGNPLNNDHLKRLPIKKEMDFKTTIVLMSEHTPGTMKLLETIASVSPMLLLHLDDMNMRGRQIWKAFDGFCKRDMEKFIISVGTRSPEMVSYVNREFPEAKAVTRGGAPR